MRASPIALLLPVLLLAGCARTEGETLARDWIRPDVQAARAPLYCYATLGRPDCHAFPIAEEDGRLKGYYGPSPALAATPLAIAPVIVAPVAAPVPAPVIQPWPVAEVAPPPVPRAAPTPLKPRKKKLSGSPAARP